MQEQVVRHFYLSSASIWRESVSLCLFAFHLMISDQRAFRATGKSISAFTLPYYLYKIPCRSHCLTEQASHIVSFLHTADLHLGLRVTRLDPKTAGHVREARFQALDTFLLHAQRLAQEGSLDFLLIAGDLFDDHAVDREIARRAFNMLDEKSPVPILFLPGNHNPLLWGGGRKRQGSGR